MRITLERVFPLDRVDLVARLEIPTFEVTVTRHDYASAETAVLQKVAAELRNLADRVEARDYINESIVPVELATYNENAWPEIEELLHWLENRR